MHTNTIAINIVQPSEIKKRNKRNAISMTGQLSGWFFRSLNIILVGILFHIYEIDLLRNVMSLFKNLEFGLISFVQIMTSPPIKMFMFKGCKN